MMIRRSLLIALRVLAQCLVLVSVFGVQAAPAPLATPNLQIGDSSGTVRAIAPLPDGGVLIGGQFERVNGLVRRGIARLNADGTLNTAWNANLEGDVYSIVVDGPSVFIGGGFQSVGGQSRVGLAAVSLADGSLLPWTASVDGYVLAMVSDGVDLYAGGAFAAAGGAARHSLARIAISTGAISPWTNDVHWGNGQGIIFALALDGGYLYIGGSFDSVGGQARSSIARASLASPGSVDGGWNASTDGSVHALAVFGSWVFAGGRFEHIDGVARRNLGRVSVVGGALDTSWTPPTSGVDALVVDASGIVAAGSFDAPPYRPGLAELDSTTGAITSWDPTQGEYTAAVSLAMVGTSLFAGMANARNFGRYSVLRFIRGGPLDQSYRVFAGYPQGGGYTLALAADGRTYVGGDFQGVEGLPIANLLRTNADGTLDAGWRPDPDRSVESIALVGQSLYAGGSFTRVGDLGRNRLAKIETGTQAIVDPTWDPNANMVVTNVASDGTDIFVAGQFSAISGVQRNGIAKLPSTGAGAPDSAWDAGWAGAANVRALVAANGSVFVGGAFSTDQTGQDNLVKLSSTTGARDVAWTPIPNSAVDDLTLVGDTLFVAGGFRRIGGVQQGGVAKLNAWSGVVDSDWMPQFGDTVGTIGHRAGVLYVGAQRVNGRFGTGANIALSAASGRPDFAWSAGPAFPHVFGVRSGQVWLGLDGSAGGRLGVAAYPEAACVAQADNSPCDGGPGVTAATCQSSICTPALATTTTTLAVSPNTAAYRATLTLTATLTSSGIAPTGRVWFYDRRGWDAGSAIIDGQQATLTISAYDDNTDFVAIYEGSPQHLPSRSGPVHVNLVTGNLVVRYRLYSPGTFEHLYTTDLNEYNVLPVCCAWQAEGAIYRVFNGTGSFDGVDAVPYYRLYNPYSHQHHWTTDANEYNVLPSMGFQQEGIDGYILPTGVSGALPLYRLYLNARGGLHLWTIDANERNYLIANAGWIDEGIAGYVIPLP